MTLATTDQNFGTIPGMEFYAGKGEMITNTSDLDSGELTVVTPFVEIYGYSAGFRENPGEVPQIWCDYTTTAGTAVFKCANVDSIEMCFLIWGVM